MLTAYQFWLAKQKLWFGIINLATIEAEVSGFPASVPSVFRMGRRVDKWTVTRNHCVQCIALLHLFHSAQQWPPETGAPWWIILSLHATVCNVIRLCLVICVCYSFSRICFYLCIFNCIYMYFCLLKRITGYKGIALHPFSFLLDGWGHVSARIYFVVC